MERIVSQYTMLGCGDGEFLKLRHLKKDYVVHYMESLNNDFKLATAYIADQSYIAMDVEVHQGQATYIQFATKKRCFVFNLYQLSRSALKKTKAFVEKIMTHSGILKIGYATDRYMRALKRTFGITKQFDNILNIDSELFITNAPPELDISSLCLRAFGLKIDTEFKQWVPSNDGLGPDDIHYVAINALAVYTLFFVLAAAMKEDINYLSQLDDASLLKSPRIMLDIMCTNSQAKLKQLKIDFRMATGMTYEGKHQLIFQ